MKLSAEQFADLASSFPGYAEDKTKHERRRAARLELRAHIEIRLAREGVIARPIKVIVNNFSTRGLGMLVHSPFPVGQQFVTELPRKSGGAVAFLCTVMHAQQVDPRLYQLGAEFTCELRQPAHQQVDAIADQLKRIRDSVLD